MKNFSSFLLIVFLTTACFEKTEDQMAGGAPDREQLPSTKPETPDNPNGSNKNTQKVEYFLLIDSFQLERMKKEEKAYVRFSVKQQTLTDRLRDLDLLMDHYFLKTNIDSDIKYYVLTDLYVPATHDFMGGLMGVRTSRLKAVDFVIPGQGRLKKMVHKKLYRDVQVQLSKKFASIQTGPREFISLLFYEDYSDRVLNSLKLKPHPRDHILLRRSRQLIFDDLEFLPLDEIEHTDIISANQLAVEDLADYEIGTIIVDNNYYEEAPYKVQIKLLIIKRTTLI